MERRHRESAAFAARHSQLLERVSGARGLVVTRGGLLLLLLFFFLLGVVMVEDSPAQQQRHTGGVYVILLQRVTSQEDTHTQVHYGYKHGTAAH